MNKELSLEQQFLSIIEEYKKVIYKVCYMYSSDKEELNDLFQEIVINLWRGYEKFRGDSTISTWIYRVGLNTCISYYRKKTSRPQTTAIISDMQIYYDDEKTQQIKELYQLINKLEKLERALILLWLDNKSYEEIAEIMGLSRNTIASKLKRTKDKLITLSNL